MCDVIIKSICNRCPKWYSHSDLLEDPDYLALTPGLLHLPISFPLLWTCSQDKLIMNSLSLNANIEYYFRYHSCETDFAYSFVRALQALGLLSWNAQDLLRARQVYMWRTLLREDLPRRYFNSGSVRSKSHSKAQAKQELRCRVTLDQISVNSFLPIVTMVGLPHSFPKFIFCRYSSG